MIPPVMLIGGVVVGLAALAKRSESPTMPADEAQASPKITEPSSAPVTLKAGDAPMEAVANDGRHVEVSHDGAGGLIVETSSMSPGAAPSNAQVIGPNPAPTVVDAGTGCADCGGPKSVVLGAATVGAVDTGGKEATIGPELHEELIKSQAGITRLAGSRMLKTYGPALGAMW